MNSQKHKTGHCCTDAECTSGFRNNYFEGKRLTADSFRVEQKYSLGRRQLLNRAIHGWGVVYGYAVVSGDGPNNRDELTIGAGLALDPLGRELVNAEGQIRLTDLMDEKGDPFDPDNSAASRRQSGEELTDECWILTAHYAEQNMGLVKVKDSCHQCECDEWDHVCETVRFSIRRVKCSECCDEVECELDCRCGSGRCCEDEHDNENEHDGHAGNAVPDQRQYENAGAADLRREHRSPKRGGCRCLCEHLTGLKLPGEPESSCTVQDRCGRNFEVDLRNGVRLACLSIVKDDRGCWSVKVLDDCGPRRLVKRNDLLFDLIRGCDLTRISSVGWEHLLATDPDNPSGPKYSMTFDQFSGAFGPEGDRHFKSTAKSFWIRFTRPVRRDTLRPECFTMTVINNEREGGWWQTWRVPIVGVNFNVRDFIDPDDPDGPVWGAAIMVRGSWVKDALRGGETIFYGRPARVEFEVRGDLIIDCNGQAIDANSQGFALPPSGNGTPGGTFISAFRVKRRERAYTGDDD